MNKVGDWYIDVFHYTVRSTGEKRYFVRIRTINTGFRVIGKAHRTATAAENYGKRFCERMNRMLEYLNHQDTKNTEKVQNGS